MSPPVDHTAQVLYRLIEEQSRTNALLERLVGALEHGDLSRRDDDQVIVGVRAICDVLGVSENTMRQMRDEGGLPVFRLPGDNRWRITGRALRLWISRRAER